MKRAALIALGTFALMACDTDRGARKDLPNDSQNLDESEALVVINPDEFPNGTHKCLEGAVGFWTTTQGNVWIVYNDPLCPGAEGTPFVLSNIAGRSAGEP